MNCAPLRQKPRSSAITISRRKLDWSSGTCSCEVMPPRVEPSSLRWPPMLGPTASDSLPVALKPFSRPPVLSRACKDPPDRSTSLSDRTLLTCFPLVVAGHLHAQTAQLVTFSESPAFQHRFL